MNSNETVKNCLDTRQLNLPIPLAHTAWN